MHIKNNFDSVTSIKKYDENIKEKYQIKNKINDVLNTLSSLYIEREKITLLSKISFFIKSIFNINVGVVFLLDKSQHAKINTLSILMRNGGEVYFKNCKLINSDFVSFKNKHLDTFFLTLSYAIKNDCHDDVKRLIQCYLYEKSKTKGDFITIINIAFNIINHYPKEMFEQLKKYHPKCDDMVYYSDFNYKQHIDMALSYVCKEINRKDNNELINSIMNLVTIMYSIYSVEMDKAFIVNITKCFIDKAMEYNTVNYINDAFKKSISNFLTNKLRNNEDVQKFVDDMLTLGVLEKKDIIKAKKMTMEDESFITKHNRRMQNIFTKNENSDEMKYTIANVIRNNHENILEKIDNECDDLKDKYKDILLDIIDYLRDDKDWNFDSLIIDYTYYIDNYLHLF
ncbi:TPA: hypothetical protein SLE41_003634 [Proteus mirabilis]|uniref:Uncharacterized protein n=2 Tax=Proteus mirabilis TaxID=584 RepID=B4F2I8_PROMH|nr:hypothetical protein [Proteus mirabilis]EKT8675466.1 hypothetical protein [Proteus mirabilis]MBG3077583.1 hypothetical protein [Proteus mirabilis]MBG3126998.1 hypothetical protein [Proteus mirabilis]MBI6385284.1 hypothetical protein [Proteus mirabilis]CAR44625.1 hypothetical protein PMI2340 [Proteus mirabilis HI4320]